MNCSSWMDLLMRKAAQAPLMPDPEPPEAEEAPALPILLRAKAESDRRHYAAKHQLLRDLIRREPHNFVIDSEKHGIVGLTHRNGFRIHLPRALLPVTLSRAC